MGGFKKGYEKIKRTEWMTCGWKIVNWVYAGTYIGFHGESWLEQEKDTALSDRILDRFFLI